MEAPTSFLTIPKSIPEKKEFISKYLTSLRSISRGTPSNFWFDSTGSKLYFTGYEEKSSNSNFYFVNVPKLPYNGELNWNLVCSEDIKSRTPMSKEEQLLRERQRAVSIGITSFCYNEKAGKFLIPAAGGLYLVDPEQQTIASIETKESGARMDAKWSPDGKLISFTRDNNIWITTPEGKELKLTNSTSRTILCGVPSFVIQEEFDRFTGYWWCPVIKHDESNEPIFRIVYIEEDETNVNVYSVPDYEEDNKQEDARYPLAGQNNTTIKLCLVEFTQTKTLSIKGLSPSLKDRYPWVEYITRVGWTPNGESVWLQILDRQQLKSSLLSFSLSQFHENTQNDSPSVIPIFEETTPVWINVVDLVHFFDNGNVLWTSEKSGYRHLYLLSPSSKSERQLTSGEWQIDNEFLEVDEERELVYFVGTKDTPLERHLYVCSYAANSSPNDVVRITPPYFSYTSLTMKITKENTLFACIRAKASTPKVAEIYSVEYTSDLNPKVTTLTQIQICRPSLVHNVPVIIPEFFSFTNQIGTTSHGMIYKPSGNVNKPLPTILYVYGGPHVQFVLNDYSAVVERFPKFHVYVALGYNVVVIDGAGSDRRGLNFEGALKHKMGTVEIKDQITGLKSLITKGIVDPNRILVTGWSYGGYLSLMALCQNPEFFKIAVSGAPVTLWESYDTGYTERYMDTPQNNPEGYKKGSVLNYVGNFPDEEGRLFIIHGLKDENVHFFHTSRLIADLVKLGKPHELIVFPGERHGVRSQSAFLFCEVKFLSILSTL